MAKLDLGSREVRYDAKKKYLTVGVMGSCDGNVFGSYELTPYRLEFIAKRIRKGRGEFDNVAANLIYEIDHIKELFKKGEITLGLPGKNPYAKDLVLEEENKEAYLNWVSLNRRMLSAIKGIIRDEKMECMGFLEHHIGDKINEIRKYPIVS